jgi:hypothetical protein
MPVDSSLAQSLIQQLRKRLTAAHERIQHCVNQLNDRELWWRPDESMNSIANILQHLCGNAQQWLIDGPRNTPNQRNRPQEFTDRSLRSKAELLQQLDGVVKKADEVLGALTEAQLLEPRRIQGFDETVLSALLNSITHFTGHSQEIVYITRLQLGPDYRFAWAPATPEQGAP